MSPKFSVVIPVYKTEKYLAKCLQTVLTQSFSDFEVIVVDDASNENAAAITTSFHDDRVKYILHEKNRSLLQARITGVKASSGEYIIPLDSDDFIKQGLLKEMNSILSSDPSIDCICYAAKEYVNGHASVFGPIYKKNKYSPEQYFEELVSNKQTTFHSLCGKIFRRTIYNEVLKKLSIPDDLYLNISEDLLFIFPIIALSSKIEISNYQGYCYVRRKGSITWDYSLLEKWESLVSDTDNVFSLLYSFYNANKPNLTKKLLQAIEESQKLFCEGSLHTLVQNSDLSIAEKAKALSFLSEHTNRETFTNILIQYFTPKPPSDDGYDILSQSRIFQKNCFTPVPQNKIIAFYYCSCMIGGVERVMSKLISIFQKNGYSVILLTSTIIAPKAQFMFNGIKTFVLPDMDHPQERMQVLKRIIQEEKINVIYWHGYDLSLLELSIFKILYSLPVICHWHGVSTFYAHEGDFLAQKRIHQLLKLVDLTLTLSTSNELFSRMNGCPSLYVPNPPTFKECLDCNTQNHLQNKIILWVGRISPEKNPFDIIKIMKHVVDCEKNIKAFIVGNTAEFDTKTMPLLKKQIQKNGLEEKVILCGAQEHVEEYYKKADIFLSTSSHEGWGMVYGEAMSFGLPIVAYDLPHLEYFRQPENGIVTVPQNDTAGAAEKILSILSDQQLHKKLSEQARNTAERFADFDYGKFWDELLLRLQNDRESFLQLDSYSVQDYQILLKTVNEHMLKGGIKLQTSLEPWQDPYKKSFSYRLALMITWPVRTARKVFTSLREGGFVYTLKRIRRKIKKS